MLTQVVARRFGLEHEEIAARLETFVLPPMRNEIDRIGGITIINDAYNSNPQSAVAAIDVLQSLSARGRRVVVFGEMRELGEQSPQMHKIIARRLAHNDIDRVVLVGAAGELMYDAIVENGQCSLVKTRWIPEAEVERVAPADSRRADEAVFLGSFVNNDEQATFSPWPGT